MWVSKVSQVLQVLQILQQQVLQALQVLQVLQQQVFQVLHVPDSYLGSARSMGALQSVHMGRSFIRRTTCRWAGHRW